MGTEDVTEVKKPQPIFKNPEFQQKFRPISVSGKKRTWRSLKQVLAQEKSLPWPSEFVHCKSVLILNIIKSYLVIFSFYFMINPYK